MIAKVGIWQCGCFLISYFVSYLQLAWKKQTKQVINNEPCHGSKHQDHGKTAFPAIGGAIKLGQLSVHAVEFCLEFAHGCGQRGDLRFQSPDAAEMFATAHVLSAQPFDLVPAALGGISVDVGKQESYYVDKSILMCYIWICKMVYYPI